MREGLREGKDEVEHTVEEEWTCQDSWLPQVPPYLLLSPFMIMNTC